MDEHRHEPEDEMVNVKVAIFFAVVVAALFFLGIIN